MATKLYTTEDFTNPITSGLSFILPVEMPFVKNLKRGLFSFSIGQSEFEIYSGTYSQKLYNRFGGEYFSARKCYGVKLISGSDDYGVEFAPSEITKTKADAIDWVNYKIRNNIFKMDGIEVPEQGTIEEIKEAFNNETAEERCRGYEMIIGWMESHKMTRDVAMAAMYGYVQVEGKWIKKKYMDRIKSDHMSKALSR